MDQFQVLYLGSVSIDLFLILSFERLSCILEFVQDCYIYDKLKVISIGWTADTASGLSKGSLMMEGTPFYAIIIITSLMDQSRSVFFFIIIISLPIWVQK